MRGIVLMAMAIVGCSGGDAVGPAETSPPAPPERAAAAPELALEPEAGFVELCPAEEGAVTPRLFYSFHPAERHAQDAPVLVLFNGGPGSATTGYLWVYGTAPYRIDPDTALTEPPSPNPEPYTRFANLLYIDARSTGFSYDTLGVAGTCARRYDRAELRDCASEDASEFVAVLLDFLDAHSPLRDNPVVIMGESYGGNRSAMMLAQLQNYAQPDVAIADDLLPFAQTAPWLKARVQEHFDRVFPAETGKLRSPEEVAAQFGWQVLIQPGTFFNVVPSKNAGNRDRAHSDFDSRLLVEDEVAMDERVVRTMHDADALRLFMGVAPRDVPLLTPERGRSGAVPRSGQQVDGLVFPSIEQEEALARDLGRLGEGDAYWRPHYHGCPNDYELPLGPWTDAVKRTHTFMTDARYDMTIVFDDVRDFLVETIGAEFDPGVPEDAVRPGVLHYPLEDGTLIDIRVPSYEAGHVVTASTPRELGEDLVDWLEATGAISSDSRKR